MPEELQQLKMEIEQLKSVINFFLQPAGYRFQYPVEFRKNIVMNDGTTIAVGTTAGLKIGTATTEKLAVYGETPIVQAGAIAAPSAPGGSYVQAEAQSAVNAINSIRTALSGFGITA